jgi:hypothetical protein
MQQYTAVLTMAEQPNDSQMEEIRKIGYPAYKKKQERYLLFSIIVVSSVVGVILLGIKWFFIW